jgi:hypothetical protein
MLKVVEKKIKKEKEKEDIDVKAHELTWFRFSRTLLVPFVNSVVLA